jgi:hypothetical protein
MSMPPNSAKIRTTVSITMEDKQMIEELGINLSGFLRTKLQELKQSLAKPLTQTELERQIGRLQSQIELLFKIIAQQNEEIQNLKKGDVSGKKGKSHHRDYDE